MVVVSAQATGAEDFIEAVWQGGELFVDEDEAFKVRGFGREEARALPSPSPGAAGMRPRLLPLE